MSLWLTFGVLSFAAHGGSAVRIFYVRRLSPGISQISLARENDGERRWRGMRQNLALGTLAIIATKQNNNELVRQEEGQRQQQRTLRGWRRGRR